MKRIFALSVIAVLVAVIAAATLVGLTSSGDAEAGGFANRSLRGEYGFSASGVIVDPNPLAGPAVAVGLVTFNGAGGCSVSDTINVAVAGIVARTSTSCTYSVNADGSGTLTPTFPGFGTTPISLVIVDIEGKGTKGIAQGFAFIRTTGTVRVGGVGERQ